MIRNNLYGTSASSTLRGGLVKWTDPGMVIEGIMTHCDLARGVIQVYDDSGNAQGGDSPQLLPPGGCYRIIDLGKKALFREVLRCVQSGLRPGWHIQLTYLGYVLNQKAGHYPWKQFKGRYAEPTRSATELETLIANGRR